MHRIASGLEPTLPKSNLGQKSTNNDEEEEPEEDEDDEAKKAKAEKMQAKALNMWLSEFAATYKVQKFI